MTRIAVITLMVLSAFELTANASEVLYFSPTLDLIPGIPGLNLTYFVIGVQGGVVGVFLLRRPSPRAIIGSVIAGGFTANYAGLTLATVTGWPLNLALYASGVGGLAICHGFVELVNWGVAYWTKRISK
jgi:hypothetical protein